MKINQITNSSNRVSGTTSAAVKDGAPRAPVGTASTSTAPSSANLNSLAAQARQLQTELVKPGSADFDTARVAEIRQAISEGRYQINAGKIADGLLNTVRDLLGKQSS